MKFDAGPLRCPCQGAHLSVLFTYTSPPQGEVRFRFSSSPHYRREIWRCRLCGHFVSVHEMDDSQLYGDDYVGSNYGNSLRQAFERIISLDSAQSDNAGRVERVLEFAAQRLPASRFSDGPSVLDVGSGLCVFLHRMKARGWDCTAIDPDVRSARHAREVVGVKTIHADFMQVQDLGGFDVITFNKVLEHVHDPVAMLAKSCGHLRSGAFVYVEVPDGEAAALEGPEREEFFIDHPQVFSATSLALLASRAGFSVSALERLREPSGKYTLRGFLTLPASPDGVPA